MKIRTFLLFICMVVVPLLAMFSHKIPTEIRAACGELILQPAIDLIETVASSADIDPASPAVDLKAPPAAPFLANTPQPRSQDPITTAGVEDRPIPAAAGIAAASLMPAAVPPQTALPSALQQNTLASTSDIPVGTDRVGPQPLRNALALAGVQRLTVEPAADGSGRLHGSCRLPVDARGELQRLFHTQALSETATLQKLLDQVNRWQQRLTAKSNGTATAPQRIR